MSRCLPLGQAEAHLWVLRLPDLRDHAAGPGPSSTRTSSSGLARCAEAPGRAPILATDEQAWLERLPDPEARREFRASRLLLRTVLSRYDPRLAGDWRFSRTDRGRLVLAAASRVEPPLHFSLAHTRGLVAVLVTRHAATGLDVEDEARDLSGFLPLAASLLSPGEARAIRQADPGAQPRLFLAHWTLREAYLKAQGLGLGLGPPPPSLGFIVSGGAAPRLAGAAAAGDGAAWHFTSVRIPPHFVAATAVRGATAVPVRLLVRDVPCPVALP
jgi:4'-phosphopantetheinyl transferase